MEEKKRTRGRHRSRSESDRLLRDYRTSGLTQSRWCKERGIGISSLRYWLRRERENVEGYSLVPIEIGKATGSNGVLDLRVNGVDLRVGTGSNLRALAVLLKELQ